MNYAAAPKISGIFDKQRGKKEFRIQNPVFRIVRKVTSCLFLIPFYTSPLRGIKP
jgi:hypothetical protein